MEALFHIVDPSVWAAARGDYRPASLAEQGFIHLSFARQIDAVANSWYADADELQVLEIDPHLLDAEVRVEDSYGAGESFPHLYGPLPVAAVTAVHDLPRDERGRFTFRATGRA